jgi:hypothetical protein
MPMIGEQAIVADPHRPAFERRFDRPLKGLEIGVLEEHPHESPRLGSRHGKAFRREPARAVRGIPRRNHATPALPIIRPVVFIYPSLAYLVSIGTVPRFPRFQKESL